MQQRTLSRPAGPDDGHELSPIDAQIDASQHLNRVGVAAAIHFPQSLGFEHSRHSWRMASTGVRAAAERDGYTVAKRAIARLASTTTATSCHSMWTGRWSMKYIAGLIRTQPDRSTT